MNKITLHGKVSNTGKTLLLVIKSKLEHSGLNIAMVDFSLAILVGLICSHLQKLSKEIITNIH